RKICKALKNIHHVYSLRKDLEIEVDFTLGTFSQGSIGLFNDFQFLRSQGLVSIADVRLRKDKEYGSISVKDASSGEQGVVVTLLGIASEISDTSLIIIDEPEIGLHPEWQEKFAPLLLDTFSNYQGCHFLIATHSPQILAKAGEGNCVVVEMESGEIEDASEFSKRSADYQLAEFFEAPGFRNEYLARESLSAIRLAGRGEFDSTEFLEKVALLRKSRPHMEEEDPVAKMIDALIQIADEKGSKSHD
ncbi:MAG: ATP-binding protein, partial [Proteobacteria bacterium]